jgi:hypothetical protein
MTDRHLEPVHPRQRQFARQKAPLGRRQGRAAALGRDAAFPRPREPQGAVVGDVARSPVSRIAHVSANALAPDLMTGIERVAEVASLLATGFLRHRLRRAPDGGEKDLAIPRLSSDSCVEPTSEGETR